MATDRSRDTYQVIAVPWPSVVSSAALWDAESTYTQAGPVPGLPVPAGDYKAALEAYGSATASTDVDVRTQQSGIMAQGEASFVWKGGSDASDEWRDWDPPVALASWEPVEWHAAPAYVRRPHALTLRDGTVLVACEYEASGSSRVVRVYIRAAAGTWSSVDVATVDQTYDRYPCLAVTEDDRVRLFHWHMAGDFANVRVYESEDYGASWTLVSRGALDEAIDTAGSSGSAATGYDLGRLRVAMNRGEAVLFASLIAHDTDPTYRAVVAHYAGAGSGSSLTQLGISDGSTFYALVEVQPYLDSFLVFRHGATSAEDDVGVYHLGSAFSFIDNLVQDATCEGDPLNLGALDGSAQYLADGEVATAIGDDGTVFVYAQMGGSGTGVYEKAVVGWYSVDGARTFRRLGVSPDVRQEYAFPLYTLDVGSYPQNLAATFQRGRVVLMHTHVSSGTNYDGSLAAAYLGGYTQVPMSSLSGSPAPRERTGWQQAWLPFDLPAAMGFTKTGAGTEAINASGYLGLTSIAQQVDYQLAPSGSVTEGLRVLASFAVTAGGSQAALRSGFRARLADGTDDWEVQIRASSTGFVVYDPNNAVTPTKATVAVDMTAGVDVRAEIVSDGAGTPTGYGAVWYRSRDHDEDREWTEAYQGSLTKALVAAANSDLTWGHLSMLTNATSRWWVFAYNSDEWAGQSLAEGLTNPDDLFGRFYPGMGLSTYVDDGVEITGRGGETDYADQWSVGPRYRFGAENLFVSDSRSPRVKLRTTGVGSAVEICVAFDPTILGARASDIGGDTITLTALGLNVRDFQIKGYNAGTSSWDTLVNDDTIVFTGPVTVVGNTCVSAGVATSGTYLKAGELVGGTLKLGSVYRRIAWNTAGHLAGGVDGRRAVIYFDDADGTESTTTTGEVWSPNICAVVNLLGNRYAGLMFRIPAQTVREDYFECGMLIPGPAEFLGTPSSHGWSVETEANTGLYELDDGTVYAERRGPARRVYQMAWTEGVAQGNVEGDSVDADYLMASTSSGAEAVASAFDTLYVLRGIIELTDGPVKPVVLIRALDKVTSGADATVLRRRDEFLPLFLDGNIRIENIHGDEIASEYARGAMLVGREVV